MLKVDLHRHLGGSITPGFVWTAILANHQPYLAESYDDVLAAMTFSHGEPYDFHRFLNKFSILDNIRWTPDLIETSIKGICAEIERERIDYTWMRFTVNKYLTFIPGWHRHTLIKYVYDCFERMLPKRVGLVLSIKYESPRANQRQFIELIDNPLVAESVIGIDLVGDEAYFDAKFYGPLLKHWHNAGKLVFAHAGESQKAENVIDAAKHMYVTEICHGIKTAENPDLLKFAVDNDLCYHMALTSNMLTGVWDPSTPHPILACLEAGVKVTVGTDDPVQCGTTLDKEFELCRKIGLTEKDIEHIKSTAEQRALPSHHR